MLNYPPLEKLLPKAENRYVWLCWQQKGQANCRWSQSAGRFQNKDPVTLAGGTGRIKQYRKGLYEPYVPLRPEIRPNAWQRNWKTGRREPLSWLKKLDESLTVTSVWV